jgi:hypothetical protein
MQSRLYCVIVQKCVEYRIPFCARAGDQFPGCITKISSKLSKGSDIHHKGSETYPLNVPDPSIGRIIKTQIVQSITSEKFGKGETGVNPPCWWCEMTAL